MRFTGERFETGVGGNIEYEHLHRFAVCRDIVRGKVVLDIASGSGVGSALFAETAKRVVGVDIDRESVAEASERFKEITNLSFRPGDCLAIPADEATFDVVISFETIEHIAEHELFLREVCRVLKPDGIFIVSTPDRHFYSDAPGLSNPFHVKELDRAEFAALLARFFPRTAHYGQRLATTSFIVDERPAGMQETGPTYTGFTKAGEFAVERTVASMQDPVYLIAVCGRSDRPVPTLPPSLYLDRDNDLYEQHHGFFRTAIREARQEIVSLDARGMPEFHRQFVRDCGAETKARTAARAAFDQACRHAAVAPIAGRVATPAAGAAAGLPPAVEQIVSQIFDGACYRELYPDVAAANLDPLAHFLAHGWREHRQPHPLVAAEWYARKNRDVAAAAENPVRHYFETGWREGRNPHPLFDVDWYFATNPELDRNETEPLLHYLTKGAQKGRAPNPLFWRDWYFHHDPEAQKSGLNPLVHYVRFGQRHVKATHPLLDGAWYFARNPGAAASGLDPLTHFLEIGAPECRDPHPLFASVWYLARHPEYQRNGHHPIWSFLAYGVRLGHDPHPLFDTRFYERSYPDVVAAGWTAIEHYIAHGSSDGRDPHPLFRGAWYVDRNPAARNKPTLLTHYVECGLSDGLAPHPEFKPSWVYGPRGYLTDTEHNPFVGLVAAGARIFPAGVDLETAEQPAAAGRPGATAAEIAPALAERVQDLLGARACLDLQVGRMATRFYRDAVVTGVTYAPLLAHFVDNIRRGASRPVPADPIDVSVIVPVHDDIVHALACLNALLSRAGRRRIEVIVGDDGSTDATFSLLSNLGSPVKVVRSDEPLGFARTCNRCAEVAGGRALLFLNSRALACAGAVDALADTLGTDPAIGVVCPDILLPSGKIEDREPSAEAPMVGVPRDLGMAADLAVLVGRDAWSNLRGFDETEPSARAGHLCARASAAGYKVVRQPAALIVANAAGMT